MKQFVIAATLLFVTASAVWAQDTAVVRQPNTVLEKLNLKIGTIIRKEFIDLYRFDAKGWLNMENLTAKILKLKDASSGIETSGIILSTYTSGSRYTSGSTYTAYIDAEEIPALLKFFEFAEALASKTEENYTEYLFNAKDLQFFLYYSQNAKKKWEWHYGVEIDKYYKGSRVDLDLKTITEQKDAITKAAAHFE